MANIIVTTRSGDVRTLPRQDDLSVMETIRDAGIDELLALCGGCLSCATCHVYVDEEFLSATMPMSTDEDELLDSSSHRTGRSRLSCQLHVPPELSGFAVTIAPED